MSAPRRAWIPPAWAPYLFVAPFFALFAVFGLFPLLFSLWLAFQSWEPTGGLGAMHWVGLDNFAFAIGDEWFWKGLWNTLWLSVMSGLPQHLVALPLAAFIDRRVRRGRDWVVGAYFLPYITSTVAVAILFASFFSTDYGLVNVTLQRLAGISGIDWLNRPEFIKPAIAMVVFWRFLGFNLVLYLAAIQTIPRDLYEAAALDGATPWRQFLHITLPSLKPMIFFGVTLSVIGGLQLFEEPFVLTNGRGGSDQAGMTAAMYLYRMAFDFNDFGGASAMSWLLFLVVLGLTWLTHRLLKPSE
ncbi:sugar ABC transporter permease [Ideonella sp. 4Y11]|uniref:Sugar ABC transporter permease n=1 Tax=Ideonella aquatica TaxID=2824119 RepID=A0A940YKA1_9BURK|nr:sugar ABC transporter permease [Ideonella aquatica]MBQ0961089.1 sugar ABC transporter permease [Ideonella aquatica]